MGRFVQALSRGRRALASTGALSLACAAALASVLVAPAPAQAATASGAKDYTAYVNPFFATQVDNGQQFPGAVVPYGIVKLSPDTYPHVNDDHAGYDYGKDKIAGFSHTRIEGVGGQGAGGDVLVTPTYATYTKKPTMESRAQGFNHDAEQATPGYYEVKLTPNAGKDDAAADASLGRIDAELTTTTRTGFHRYTFPADGDVSIVLDLNYTYHGTDVRDAVLDTGVTADGKPTVSGRFTGRNVSGHGTYTMYFYTVLDTSAESVRTWDGSDFGRDRHREGNDLGAVLQLKVKAGQKVQLKTAISPISVDQARVDMEAEDAGWDFDAVRDTAKGSWNKILGRVDVESSKASDPTGDLTKLFYTSLYHMFTTPVNATSTSGTYRGTDGKVYRADGYTHYDSWTMWDDFRKYPLIGLVAPDVYRDIVQSVADMFVTGIDTWGKDGQPVPTVRNEHAVALLADGVSKGFTDIKNLDRAYEAAKDFVHRSYPSEADSLGYVPGRVDQTVERSYDYWALSKVASALGKGDEAASELEQAMGYKKIYRTDAVTAADGSKVGLLWPKDVAGNWQDADPERYGEGGLYQGTIWQYTWWDSNDVGGLIDLMGGKEKTLSALETLYGAKGPDADGSRMLHSNTNEIDLQTPYYFNWVGKPSETQYWVRQIYTGKTWNRYSGTGEFNPPQYTQAYKLAPDGLLATMDDDAGTMTGMYAAAAMGVFPLSPGDPSFQIGSPFFEKMTLDVGNGKTFTVKADGVSPDSYYIQSAKLDGASFSRTWLDYGQIARGGELALSMGSKASDWAADGDRATSASDTAASSAYQAALSFVGEGLQAQNGSVDATVMAKLTGAQFADGAGLAGAVHVDGLPDGVKATVSRAGDAELKIALKGDIEKVEDEVSSYELRVTFDDAAFDGVKAAQVADPAASGLGAVRLVNTMKPTAIEVKAPAKTVYGLGAALDPEGGSVTVRYGASSYTRVLPLGSSALTVGELPDKVGKGQKVAVSYQGLEGSFEIEVRDTRLADAVARGNDLLDNGVMDDATAASLQKAVDAAAALQGYADAGGSVSEDDIKAALDALNKAIDDAKQAGAGSKASAYDTIQAEAKDDWGWADGKGALKTETSHDNTSNADVGDVGNTFDGSWLAYKGVDFGDTGAKSLTVRYVNNSNRCGTNSRVEVYLDKREGDPIATVQLPVTADNWNVYGEATADISAKVTGTHTVYMVMRTDGGNAGYVANFDWFRFAAVEETTVGKVEAEVKSDWGQADGRGALKIEQSTDSDGKALTNVGNTFDGSWLAFSDLNFGDAGKNELEIRYVNNAARCGRNNRVEIRLDSRDGEPFATVPLPQTGSNWSAYDTVKALLPQTVTGTHAVYLTLRTDGGNAGYVANLDWISFGRDSARDVLKAAIAKADDVLKDADSYDKADITRLQSAVDAGSKLLKDDSASADDLAAATDRVNVALGRMHKKASVESLKELIGEAEKLDTNHWTEGTRKALESALGYARKVTEAEQPTQAQVDLATTRLNAAMTGGEELPEADKRALSGLISQTWAIGPTGCDKTAWDALQQAIKDAKKVQADRWASDADVSGAIQGLKTARAAL